jgi:hypothetical protein
VIWLGRLGAVVAAQLTRTRQTATIATIATFAILTKGRNRFNRTFISLFWTLLVPCGVTRPNPLIIAKGHLTVQKIAFGHVSHIPESATPIIRPAAKQGSR